MHVSICLCNKSQEVLGKQHMEAVRVKSQIDIEEALHREESIHAKELEKQLQVWFWLGLAYVISTRIFKKNFF